MEPTFVTCACNKDIHYAKALVGSIRYFYPDAKVIAILDEDVSQRDTQQLARRGVRAIPVHDLIRGHKLYLTGLLNKFNVLFLPGLEEALICDADSVLVGPVLEMIDRSKDFVALNGTRIELKNPGERASFDEWAIDLQGITKLDPDFQADGFLYFLQTSHFFIKPNLFPVDELIRNLAHLSLQHGGKTIFRAGDQGFWNYVVNKQYVPAGRFALNHVTLPANEGPQNHPELRGDVVCGRKQQRWGFVHYVGFSRKYQLSAHNFGDLLVFFTRQYYGGWTFEYWMDEFLRGWRTALRVASRRLAVSR
jgi:hypothetical protein